MHQNTNKPTKVVNVRQSPLTLSLQRRHRKAIDSVGTVRDSVLKNFKALVELDKLNTTKMPPNKKWHVNKSQELNAAVGQSKIIENCYREEMLLPKSSAPETAMI